MEAALDDNLRNFSAMRELGVSFVAGTDAGWRFTRFDGLAQELSLMQAGDDDHGGHQGVNEQERRGAGRQPNIGAIRPGLEADIIAVEGDPLRSDLALRKVRFVMRAGDVVFSSV